MKEILIRKQNRELFINCKYEVRNYTCQRESELFVAVCVGGVGGVCPLHHR